MLPECQLFGTLGCHLCEVAEAMLMDFVDGRVIESAETAASLSVQQASEISQELVDTLARLHAVDPVAAGLDQLGRPAGYLQRQVKRWGEQWQITKTRELPEIEALHSWLETAIEKIPDSLPNSIVHGDYRIDNVILDKTSSKIVAVLDWEMSTLGDPISDLAISLVYWSQATDTLRRKIPVAEDVTSGPGFWSRQEVLDRYIQQTGLDVSHLDACQLAYDMMYGKQPTTFLLWCQQHNVPVCADGIGMLVAQAAASFAIWRGVEPDVLPVLEKITALVRA